jgi:hypothetical protein
MRYTQNAKFIRMSIRENIELYHSLDLQKYLQILSEEFHAQQHPSEPNAYMAEGLPFYQPRQLGDHISILGFNKIPIPDSVVEALIQHPELIPDNALIRWTQEQELIFEGTVGELRQHPNNP